MDPAAPSLFDLADQRLAWLDRRQQLLAQNIANADTPGWRPRDLAPFSLALGRTVTPSRTQPGHLDGRIGAGAQRTPRPREVAPDGNAVALDAELTKLADTDHAQELVTSLYHRYLALFQLALGHQG